MEIVVRETLPPLSALLENDDVRQLIEDAATNAATFMRARGYGERACARAMFAAREEIKYILNMETEKVTRFIVL